MNKRHLNKLGAQIEALEAEVKRLRELAAMAYAGLGAECDLPENWLDALSDASEGRPFTTEGLLPFVSPQRHDAERYQYIRTGKHYALKVGQDTIHCGGHSVSPKYGPALDKAIDEARKVQPQQDVDLKSREAFEDWWEFINRPIPINNRIREDGKYADHLIQAEWEKWQKQDGVKDD